MLHPTSPAITIHLQFHSYITFAVSTLQDYESVKLLYETQGLRAISIKNIGLKTFVLLCLFTADT